MMKLYAIRRFVSRKVWNRSARIMGRVTDFRCTNTRLSGYVLSSDRNMHYNPWIDNKGEYYCDCQGYEGHEVICSHIMALLRIAEFEDRNVDPFLNGLLRVPYEVEEMKYETSLESYNTLFGGLRTGKLSALISPPNIGKSYLMAQFMADMIQKHGKNSLLIDTEGGFTDEWLEVIAERIGIEIDIVRIKWKVATDKAKKVTKNEDQINPIFNYKDFSLPKESDRPTVYIYNARHVVTLMPFLGRPLMFKIKSGVIEPLEAGGLRPIQESPMGLLVEKRNVGFVALDSLSAPIESLFTGGQINYRTRAKAEQAILGRGQDLVDEYPVVFMITTHATIQHSNQYAKPSHVGGKAVLHNVKWAAYMEAYSSKKVAKAAKKDFPDLHYSHLRMLKIYRHPLKSSWSEVAYCRTTSSGIQDFPRERYVKGDEDDE